MTKSLLKTETNWKLPSLVGWRIELDGAAEMWLQAQVLSACADYGVSPHDLFARPRRKIPALGKCRVQVAVSMLDNLAMCRDALGTRIELAGDRVLGEYDVHHQMQVSRISTSATARILGVVPSTIQHQLGAARARYNGNY